MMSKPSWVDRLFRWLERLPGPNWIPYLAIYLIGAAALHLAVWFDGVQPWGTIVPARLIDSVWSILGIGFIHYLTNASLRAMGEFEVLFEHDPTKVQALRERLSFMPAGPVLALSIPFAALTSWLTVSVDGFAYEGGPESAASITLVLLDVIFSYSLAPVLMYYVIRLLRSIRAAYRALDTVSSYRQQPLNSFAGVTMRASLLWILVANINFIAVATDPEAESVLAFELTLTIAALVLAVITFLVPLLGVHRRLRIARATALDENGRHLDELSRRLYASIGSANADELKVLDGTLATLHRVRDDVRRQHTWPWDPGTLRTFLSAVILPLVVWGMQNWLSGLV